MRRMLGLVAIGFLSACGGGGNNANPFDNPPEIGTAVPSGQLKLSFAYFQRCIQPILEVPVPVTVNGATVTASCASAGCHGGSAGGALRITAGAEFVNFLPNPADPDAIRATPMFRNYLSAQAMAVPGRPASSALLNAPLRNGLAHGGVKVFANAASGDAQVLAYWISRPAPQGQDEFSPASNLLFPVDVTFGLCNVQ